MHKNKNDKEVFIIPYALLIRTLHNLFRKILLYTLTCACNLTVRLIILFNVRVHVIGWQVALFYLKLLHSVISPSLDLVKNIIKYGIFVLTTLYKRSTKIQILIFIFQEYSK